MLRNCIFSMVHFVSCTFFVIEVLHHGYVVYLQLEWPLHSVGHGDPQVVDFMKVRSKLLILGSAFVGEKKLGERYLQYNIKKWNDLWP